MRATTDLYAAIASAAADAAAAATNMYTYEYDVMQCLAMPV